MGDGAAYNYIAMEEAIADAGLEQDEISMKTDMIMGSGGPSTKNLLLAWDTAAIAGQKNWAVYGTSCHVEHEFRNSCHTLQNQGR